MIPSRTCSPVKVRPSALVKASSLSGTSTIGFCQPPVRQVGKDAQVNASAGDLLDVGSKFFAGGVDSVGAHGIPHIVDQLHDQERTDGRILNDTDFQVACPAAEFYQHRVSQIGFSQQFGFMFM